MIHIKSFNESIRDFLKPKSKEEILKQLGGREDAIFKPTDKLQGMSYFIGTYEISYKELVKIFGEPNSEGDYEKISTEWNLEDDKGNLISISDYKVTDVYDPDYPSVDDFRAEPSYNWRIYSDNREIKKDFLTFIYLKSLSLNENIMQYLKPKSEDEILKSIKTSSPNDRLYNGVKYNLIDMVKQALKDGADPSFDSNKSLEIATHGGNLEIVKLLLNDKRVDPKGFNNRPLDYACLKGHIDIVKELLKYKNVDPSEHNCNSIDLAYRYKQKDIVELLMKDYRIYSKMGMMNIRWREYAQYVNDPTNESIRQYLKPKSEEDIIKLCQNLSKDEKLIKGCELGILSIVKQGLEEGANPKDGICFSMACKYGHIDIVKLLLKDKRINPSGMGNEAIWWASETDNKDILKLLLNDERIKHVLTKHNLEKYTRQSQSLKESITQYLKPRSEDEIKRLLDDLNPEELLLKSAENGYLNGVKDALNTDFDSKTIYAALELADSEDHWDIVKYIIHKSHKLINSNDMLMLGVQCNDPWIVKKAIDKGVDVNLIWFKNNDALKHSIKHNYFDIVKLLLDNNVKVRKEHMEMASYSDYNKECKELLMKWRNTHLLESVMDYLKPKSKEKLDIICKDFTWNQKFEYGCLHGILSWVKDAIEHGIHPANMNNNGITSAMNNNHREIVELLYNDKRVQDRLLGSEKRKYYNYLYDENESIKDYLKPKSEEEIQKNIPIELRELYDRIPYKKEYLFGSKVKISVQLKKRKVYIFWKKYTNYPEYDGYVYSNEMTLRGSFNCKTIEEVLSILDENENANEY